MKYALALLSLIILLGATDVVAQTPVTAEIANTYFQSCKSQTDPRFSAASQEMFCACTAAQMVENFTQEDMQAAQAQNATGRAATNKLIVNVYAPCIQYPAREYHYNSCITNPKTKVLGGNTENLCQCTAQQVANHLGANAKLLFEKILAINPNVADPMQALYDDRNFQATTQKQLMACLGR